MLILVYTFITSMVIALFVIPSIIRIADIKNLYDEPTTRKKHRCRIPTLGGLAIFSGTILAMTFWANQAQIQELQYIITALTLLFFMGMKDDIVTLVPRKKLIVQIIVALILIHFAGIRINTFYGLFGLNEIPTWVSYLLSLIAIVGITNAFNLIDGIDTLASVLGIISALSFGYWFYLMGQLQYAILSSALIGSLFAFIWYNKTPAKIFMGDTGALIIGIVSSILALKFIETVRVLPIDHIYKIRSAPIFALSVLSIPLVDTLRVFLLRTLRGRSPFSPDREHFHYQLVDSGFSHLQATGVLALINIVAIFASIVFQGKYVEILIFAIPLGIVFLVKGISFLREKKNLIKTTERLRPKPQ